MNKTLAVAFVAGATATAPAFAADLYVAPEPVAPLISGTSVYNWTGMRIGIGAGTGMSNNFISAPAISGLTLGGLGGRGFVGTLTAGYDHAFSNGVVVGGAITGRYGDVDSSWTTVGPASTGEVTADYGFDVVGRVGYSITPRTLAYVLGGYSWQHFKLSGTGTAASQKWGASGYVVGFGTETAIRDNWTLSSEYRYANYGSESVAAYRGSIEPEFHTFNTSLNYRFAGGPSGQTMTPVAYDWTGIKVGGSLGLNVALSEVSTTAGVVFDSTSNEAFVADVLVGYDREFGTKWLGGVVLAAGYDGGRNRSVFAGTIGTVKTEDFGFDAMVRVGRKFNGDTLGYLIGGYSWQKMTGTLNGGAGSNSTGVNGFTIGSGTEFALSEKLTAFVEYRYTGFEDFNINATTSVDPSNHSVRVGAKWKLY